MSSADKGAALNARALFDAIDVDGGGTVDRDELRRGLQRLGKSPKEIALMIGAMKSDELTFDDFQDLLTATHGDLQANLHATLLRRTGMALVEVWRRACVVARRKV
jgi:Xaa-Pro aminopeptidase